MSPEEFFAKHGSEARAEDLELSRKVKWVERLDAPDGYSKVAFSQLQVSDCDGLLRVNSPVVLSVTDHGEIENIEYISVGRLDPLPVSLMSCRLTRNGNTTTGPFMTVYDPKR